MESGTGRLQLTAETKVALLLDVSQRTRGTLDLDEILERLLSTLATLVDFDAGGMFVLSESMVHPRIAPGQLISGVARRGYDPSPEGRDPMLFRGAGITGHVIRNGEFHLAPDVRLDPHYVVGRATTHSEVAVPIRWNGHAVGAINLESDRLDAFGARELDVLSFFAGVAAIAIEKATLHERLLENERLERQMRLAQEVQARLLPGRAPDVPGWSIAGRCIPTLRIGGDYFDAIALPDGRIGLVVADVAGKGVAAALVMSAFRALVRDHFERGLCLGEIACTLNRRLPDVLAGTVFVTAFLAVLDPSSGALSFINCGHNPPFVVRAGADDTRRMEWLATGGTVLGAFADATFERGETHLAPGDLLLLYTDGVVESGDCARRDFGAERLATVTTRLAQRPPEQLIEEIVLLNRSFSGAVEFDDDFTLLAVRRGDPATTRVPGPASRARP